ncbi:SirB2 family protein [Microbulbifer sp. SAOS-129_SWC]|uniref:SirB2 family protein n=1 Tax=Microbulbifer sp. SAOS-129_SWC TaxID=3145235 RepID=UPI003217B575
MANILWLKYLHIALAATSVSFFAARLVAREMRAQFVQTRWAKVSPHLIDTLLLGSGVGLAVLYRLSPLHTHWLLIKLILVVGYIAAGFGAMKAADAGLRRFFALLALGLVGGVVTEAVGKY